MNTNVDFSIPNSLYKHVVVCGYLHSQAASSLSARISRARNECNTFAFLEWAEPFITDYNRMQRVADVRLMADEELAEHMNPNGSFPHYIF